MRVKSSAIIVWTMCPVLLVLLLIADARGAPEPAPGNAGVRLEQVETQVEEQQRRTRELATEAKALEDEAAKIEIRLVALAGVIQNHEARTMKIEDRIVVLRADLADKTTAMKTHRRTFSLVLMALQRLARHPPEVMLLESSDPTNMVRSAILLRASLPEIESRARSLRRDAMALSASQRLLSAERVSLAAEALGLDRRRSELKRMLASKAERGHQTQIASRAAAKKTESLAKEARGLRDLMAKLAIQHRVQEAARRAIQKKKRKKKSAAVRPAEGEIPISQARGKLPFPVVGRIKGLYGQRLETGLTRKGISIATAPHAQVVAPYAGTIVFAGEFRGYGLLLIIDHGEGYHTLLAGMAEITGVIGQRVSAGGPVGIMGMRVAANPEIYVELRRNNQPINPLPWLAARKEKVSG